jgi:hypothetical protein
MVQPGLDRGLIAVVVLWDVTVKDNCDQLLLHIP